MNITPQGIEQHQTVLQIEVEPERLQRAMQQAARRLATRYRIAGFRPGKAPYSLIVQRFGEEMVLDEALEQLGPQIYQDAVAEQGLEPYAPGRIDVVEREPLTFRALVPLKPSVDAADYRSVKVEAPDYEVDEEDVEDIVEELQEQEGTWNPVERAAQLDDQVTLTVHGDADGERIIDTHDQEVVLSADSFREFPPDFVDELIGLSAGDGREFTLTYPEDFERESLRGKEAQFELTVGGVKERELPPLTDEFAAGLGLQGVTNLDELRERIRINEAFRRARDARSELEEKVLDAVVDQALIEYPPILAQRELEDEVERQAESMQRMGFTLENYLRFSNTTPDQFRAGLLPSVERRIRRALLLDEIATREGLSAPEGTPPDMAGNARLRAALNWLIESASGKGPDWPPMPQLPSATEVEEAEEVEEIDIIETPDGTIVVETVAEVEVADAEAAGETAEDFKDA